jgi:hypothetical protein
MEEGEGEDEDDDDDNEEEEEEGGDDEEEREESVRKREDPQSCGWNSLKEEQICADKISRGLRLPGLCLAREGDVGEDMAS